MKPGYSYRSNEKERMEQPGADPAEVAQTLDYIHFVNRYLGGFSTLRHGLDFMCNRKPQKKAWRILDLGCGDGRQLVEIQKWAQQNGLEVHLTGLDMSEFILQKAKSNSTLQGVEWVLADVLDPNVDFSAFDFVTGTLFFHHLSDAQIEVLLSRLNKSNALVLINDLHRSPLAGMLFTLFTYLTRAPRMARFDGKVSIRRGFKRNELEQIGRNSGFRNQRVQWRWAFRFLVLLWNE